MKRSSLAVVCVLSSACSSGLEEHRALWAGNGPSSYQYTFGTTGFLPHFSLRVTVESRAVSSTTVLSSGGFSGPFEGQTIEQLFEDIQQRLDSTCKTTASYDESLGYPLSVHSNCGEEGDGWIVTDFVPGTAPDGGSG